MIKTVEEKAKRYDEAIERAKYYYDKGRTPEYADYMASNIFPELKESEDERIRKALMQNLKERFGTKGNMGEGLDMPDVLTWLEKQGEQNQKHFELKAGHWYICHRAFCCRADHLTVKEGERFMCEKDGIVKGFVIKEPEKYFKEVCAPAPIEDEQKPADKVEPKFHEGEWINGYYTNYKVLSVNNDGYVVEDVDGNKINILFENEKFHHLFTISDAKDGDVLALNDEVFIYAHRKQMYSIAVAQCFVDSAGGFYLDGEFGYTEKGNSIHPATKEQRDTLMKAMADAGYTFDFEKKKLKKIEQKSAEWSEEDERTYRGLHDLIYSTPYCDSRKELSDWLKSLKDRVHSKQKQAWGKEDEKCIRLSTDIIDSALRAGFCVQLDRDRCVDWLKSLQPQSHWKPSDKQLKSLRVAIDVIGERTLTGIDLKELLEQLKLK